VGRDFPVALKLNSDDFRKGGFSHEECLQVVAWLNDESVDLLEISGARTSSRDCSGPRGAPPTPCPFDAARGRAKPISSSTQPRYVAWPACQ
jgi:2,4-dienoyl-CoA reductase-like NADH-dependent reductase (Old Yellow Enzyme family)